MKKLMLFTIIFNTLFCSYVYAANSMFDDSGNYSGNWKQMTNVSTCSSQKYSNNSYSTSSWYNSQKQSNRKAVYSSGNQMDIMPFRYNTLDYTRIRKVKGGYGDYSAKCTDIGDASFCQ